jgi:hypothetical protein
MGVSRGLSIKFFAKSILKLVQQADAHLPPSLMFTNKWSSTSVTLKGKQIL